MVGYRRTEIGVSKVSALSSAARSISIYNICPSGQLRAVTKDRATAHLRHDVCVEQERYATNI